MEASKLDLLTGATTPKRSLGGKAADIRPAFRIKFQSPSPLRRWGSEVCEISAAWPGKTSSALERLFPPKICPLLVSPACVALRKIKPFTAAPLQPSLDKDETTAAMFWEAFDPDVLDFFAEHIHGSKQTPAFWDDAFLVVMDALHELYVKIPGRRHCIVYGLINVNSIAKSLDGNGPSLVSWDFNTYFDSYQHEGV